MDTGFINQLFRKELLFQEEKNQDLTAKLKKLSIELTNLQQHSIEDEKTNRQKIHALQDALSKERKLCSNTEEELRTKTKVCLGFL